MVDKRIDVGLGLQGTPVLVTGAGGMIGSCVVAAFLSAGANVTCWDIDEAKSANLRSDPEKWIPSDTLAHSCRTEVVDVSHEGAVDTALDSANCGFGYTRCYVALAAQDLSVLQHHESIADIINVERPSTLM